jgi:hypothetical protein
MGKTLRRRRGGEGDQPVSTATAEETAFNQNKKECIDWLRAKYKVQHEDECPHMAKKYKFSKGFFGFNRPKPNDPSYGVLTPENWETQYRKLFPEHFKRAGSRKRTRKSRR